MKLRKAWLLVLLLALTQLLAAASAEDAHEDASDSENPIEDDDDEEEDEEDEDDLEVKEENGVWVLNDENFDNFVADKDTVLLEFYAPWCGHCKQFAPEYEKIASTLKDNDPPIAVAKIDATSASMLASKFDVSGYPTIKILKKGQAVDYDGSRTQEEIVAKVREVSQPDWTPPPEVTLTLTKENFDDVVNNADIILVEFYAPWCGHCKKLAPEYEKAAKELSKRSPPIPLAKVDATEQTDLAKRFDVSGYPTLKIFRKGRPFDYNGPREKYGIVDYMVEQSGPPSNTTMPTPDSLWPTWPHLPHLPYPMRSFYKTRKTDESPVPSLQCPVPGIPALASSRVCTLTPLSSSSSPYCSGEQSITRSGGLATSEIPHICSPSPDASHDPMSFRAQRGYPSQI